MKQDHSTPSAKQHPKQTLLKYQQLSQIATDRINALKEPSFNIKEKIAIRKHKAVKTTQYREPTDNSITIKE